MIRSAAARVLDIGVGELDVGVSFRQLDQRDDRRDQTEVFLADHLENGAGYATWLGQPDALARLLTEGESLIEKFSEKSHDCDSSCPDCLRDFSNLIFHPLLDWRLARDLFEVLLDRDLKTDRWGEEEQRAAKAFAEAFGGVHRSVSGDVQVVFSDQRALVIHHPLEEASTSEHAELTERLDEALVEVEAEIGSLDRVQFETSFDLDRRPGAVAAKFQAI